VVGVDPFCLGFKVRDDPVPQRRQIHAAHILEAHIVAPFQKRPHLGRQVPRMRIDRVNVDPPGPRVAGDGRYTPGPPLLRKGSLKLPGGVGAGGVFGAIYVAGFTLLVPRIGAAGMICLAVLGQVTASLLLDQFGILQAPKPVDAVRIVGALLVLAGVVLVVAPWRTPAKTTAGTQQPISETR